MLSRTESWHRRCGAVACPGKTMHSRPVCNMERSTRAKFANLTAQRRRRALSLPRPLEGSRKEMSGTGKICGTLRPGAPSRPRVDKPRRKERPNGPPLSRKRSTKRVESSSQPHPRRRAPFSGALARHTAHITGAQASPAAPKIRHRLRLSALGSRPSPSCRPSSLPGGLPGSSGK